MEPLKKVDKVNINQLIKHEKEITEIKGHDEMLSPSVTDDPLRIKSAIKLFKVEFLNLFEKHTQATCFKLVPKNNQTIALTLFRDQLILEDHFNDNINRTLIIDFKTNTLRANGNIIGNLDLLKKILTTIDELVQGLASGKVDIYEK